MPKEWTHAELLDDLRTSCGIKPGQILMLHSSARAIGPVEGSVVTLVKVIKEAVTEEGTLLLPTFNRPPASGVWKVKREPSIVGLLTEAFRRSADVKRSLHPTHSVCAWGKRRDELLAGHENTTGLGVDSPFHKAANAGADILHIGCSMTTCSLVHVGEAIVRVPYLGKVSYGGYDTTLTLIDYDGNEHEFPLRDNPGDSKAFTRVQDEMEKRGMIHHCKVGDADCLKFNGMDALNVTVEMLQADPAVLLCDKETCPVCAPSKKIIAESMKAED